MKMLNDEDVLFASTATLVILNCLCAWRPRRFWVCLRLIARSRYSTAHFIKDLILDDVNELNLKYRSYFGFRNFFRMKSSIFENILNMTPKKCIKPGTELRKAITPHKWLALADKIDKIVSIPSSFPNKTTSKSIEDDRVIIPNQLFETNYIYVHSTFIVSWSSKLNSW